MNVFENAIYRAAEKAINKIEISFFARVVSYDKEAMTAEITPLMKTEVQKATSEKAAIVHAPNFKDIRVDREPGIRPIYEQGDIVHCVCSASPIEEPIENDRPVDILSGLKFSPIYCTIKGKVKKRSASAPSHYASEDGLILSDDPNFYIAFRDDQNFIKGKTVIDGASEINGNSRSLVTHAELNTKLQTLVGAINTAFLAKLDGGGSSPALTLDISTAKTDNIKTGSG